MYHIINRSKSIGFVNQLSINPISFILTFFTFAAIIFTYIICNFHMFLICVGKTTHEQLKSMVPRANPYSRTGILNFIDVFMSFVGPTCDLF